MNCMGTFWTPILIYVCFSQSPFKSVIDADLGIFLEMNIQNLAFTSSERKNIFIYDQLFRTKWMLILGAGRRARQLGAHERCRHPRYGYARRGDGGRWTPVRGTRQPRGLPHRGQGSGFARRLLHFLRRTGTRLPRLRSARPVDCSATHRKNGPSSLPRAHAHRDGHLLDIFLEYLTLSII